MQKSCPYASAYPFRCDETYPGSSNPRTARSQERTSKQQESIQRRNAVAPLPTITRAYTLVIMRTMPPTTMPSLLMSKTVVPQSLATTRRSERAAASPVQGPIPSTALTRVRRSTPSIRILVLRPRLTSLFRRKATLETSEIDELSLTRQIRAIRMGAQPPCKSPASPKVALWRCPSLQLSNNSQFGDRHPDRPLAISTEPRSDNVCGSV